MRLRLMLAVFLVGSGALLIVPTVGAPTAAGQDDLEAARVEVAEATERLETLFERLETTQQRGNELAGEFWQVESTLTLIDGQIALAEQDQETLGAERAELVEQVRDIALSQYVAGTDPMGLDAERWADLESMAIRETSRAFAELVVGSEQDAIDRLLIIDAEYERQQDDLEAQRVEQQQTLAEVEATQAGIVEELAELESIRAALEGELERLEDALAALEAAEAERLAEEERVRLEEERRRAEEAAARAAALARAVPTPAPIPTPVPIPTSTPVPAQTPEPTGTAIPNPTPSQPFPTATALPGQAEPTASPVPNPTPSQPFPTATPIPNPTPSQPFPTATPVPNPQPVPSGGGIVCPLAGPFTHTDDFNAPRAVGGVHRANDLIAASGVPVLAVASGTVEHRDSSVGGLSAHLRGDNGDYYFYTHLSGYENVGAGHVPAGAVIGYVGMTGNAPIPHLHFEIHRGGYGNYANPFGPVRAACGT
ncbi:MAG: peptidoglycan DD-metalloendopeptidase family protein [Actinomycetota bacterium]